MSKREGPSLGQNAEAMASAMPPLLVAAEQVAATVLQGVHGRRRVGQGESFWQFRRYGVGDSATRIDWRQSARTRHLYVRENEWEVAQSVWLWADSSNSMAYRSSPELPKKRDRARLLLLALASLLSRGGERFALLDSGAPPSTGRGALFNLAESLVTPGNEAGLPVHRELPVDAHVALFGDFLETVPQVRDAVMDLAGQGLSGHIVHILDPAELELPFEGRLRFQGFEGENEALIDRVDAVRSNYRGRIEGHCAALHGIARDAGWNFIAHGTDGSPETCLLTLYLALSPENGV
tara:strand:- start:1067 stop:1948 length:882 start_codon:yes stop_codon:yes gene_type:complete